MTQHHHPPPPQDPMPLDPEERALAARLARLGPHGEPSPALDARVLAAAHAATAGTDGRAAREHGWRRARWPVGAGLAASVALAAAIAWQMRPLPAPMVPAAESAAATSAPMSTPSPAAAQVVAGTEPASDNVRVAAPGDAVPARRRAVATPKPAPQDAARAAAGEARDTAAAKAMAPPRPQSTRIVYDEPSPVEVAVPPPPPPAPPAAPASAARSAAAKSANAMQATQSTQAQETASAPPALAPARAATAAAAGAEAADAPEADVPPATAASPEVREAWLARIRELAAAGRMDEARASLAEFRRRHPAYAIPEDLRPLLAQPPAP